MVVRKSAAKPAAAEKKPGVRRGRPPKSAAKTATSEVQAKTAKAVAAPKRRGRPPKSESKTPALAATPKRGPGRPRKTAQAPAAAANAAKPRRGRPPKTAAAPKQAPAKTDHRNELRRELGSLRSSFKQALEQFQLRLSGQFVELASALDAQGKDARPALPSRSSKQMVGAIRATKLKPGKGRLKDLERIHDLVRELLELLPERP
jgi:hypothetical protein